ncbi:hypothetical protein K474DRAFT_1709746 [Panus rudis PR-1116 ss-1]|nr:hypothetical protein K474DRAFT_1709746 [Panus rudis PR-1116 ss-1]
MPCRVSFASPLRHMCRTVLHYVTFLVDEAVATVQAVLNGRNSDDKVIDVMFEYQNRGTPHCYFARTNMHTANACESSYIYVNGSLPSLQTLSHSSQITSLASLPETIYIGDNGIVSLPHAYLLQYTTAYVSTANASPSTLFPPSYSTPSIVVSSVADDID